MYTMKAVSERTGIPAVTIRAWEQRYGAVEPERTAKGQRLYRERDIEALLWLKEQTEKGMTISQAVRQLKQEPAAPQGPAEPADFLLSSGAGTKEEAYREWQDGIYAELSDYREAEAQRLLDTAFALFSFQDVFHRILAPMMYRAGDDWGAGLLSVAQEHYISHFVTMRFSHFFRLFPVRPELPRFVAFCPSGEHHQLGLLLFTLFLRQQGADVLYLGADTPLDGLASLIRKKGIGFACVSLTLPERAELTCRMLKELQREAQGLQLVAGGSGFRGVAPQPGWSVLDGGPEAWKHWFDRCTAGTGASEGA
ncbi:MerR family transcriptional regulator [Gorillibacterium sp. sgz5001074]|uniref:MerR family transcriptional regulator n=1 Tax=Gorillibacterium sp. sgz5001074 TaxID=3446695 RepID=UPI003F66852D